MANAVRSGKERFMLDVPFYMNTTSDGNQCYPVAMRSVIKYFLGKDLELERLDELIKRRPRKLAAATYIVPVLHELGLEVRFFSRSPLEPNLGGAKYIRDTYGQDAKRILSMTDVEVLVESTKRTINQGLFEQKVLSMSEIEGHLRNGHVPIALVDWNKVVGKASYEGHVLLITGFDAENLYVHQSGPSDPTPNLRISKKTFLEAWNANGTDNDIVIVYGIRKPNVRV